MFDLAVPEEDRLIPDCDELVPLSIVAKVLPAEYTWSLVLGAVVPMPTFCEYTTVNNDITTMSKLNFFITNTLDFLIILMTYPILGNPIYYKLGINNVATFVPSFQK